MSNKKAYIKSSNLTILLAEDNPSDALVLSKILCDLDHEVIVAKTGLEALELFFTQNIDLTIIDIGLPDISGLELAENFHNSGRIIPVLFTTATVDDDILSRCYETGAGDLLLKPYIPSMIKIKMRAYHKLIRMNSMFASQRDVIAKSNRDLLGEQKAARRIFDKLSDNATEENECVRYNMNALSVFNGDLVLTAKSPAGETYVLLGDFTGHGLVASLSSVPLIQTFSRMVEKGFSMADILQEVNNRLNRVLPREMFCCAVLAMLSPRKNEIQIWNGGLPDCYLYSSDDNNYEVIPSKHLPLGVLKSNEFRMKIDTFRMKKGDRLLVCSDGILEGKNSNGEMFGSQRIIDVLDSMTPTQDLFESIAKSAEVFSNGGIRDDDVTLVEVVMPEAEAFELKKVDAEQNIYELKTNHISGRLNYVIDAQMIQSGNPVTTLMQLLLKIPGIQTIRSELFTLMTELYANALDHGVLDLDSKLKNSAEGFDQFYRTKKERMETLDGCSIGFFFEYSCSQTHGEITITVEDSGEGFNIEEWKHDKEVKNNFSGRGLNLISEISSEMEIIEPGNKIKLLLNW